MALHNLTRPENLLSESLKYHYGKDTANLFSETARNSIGSVMPAKSLELKHTIKLIQYDEMEAAIKHIIDKEVKTPILTIPIPSIS